MRRLATKKSRINDAHSSRSTPSVTTALGWNGLRDTMTESAFFVGCAYHDALDLRPPDCPGTHQARFYRDIQSALGKVLAPEGFSRRRYGLHLGMGGYIVERLGEVMSTAYDAPFAHNYSPYRDFPGACGLSGFCQSHPHISFVIHIQFKFNRFKQSTTEGCATASRLHNPHYFPFEREPQKSLRPFVTRICQQTHIIAYLLTICRQVMRAEFIVDNGYRAVGQPNHPVGTPEALRTR